MATERQQTSLLTLHHLSSSGSFIVLMALEEVSALRSEGLKYDLKRYPRQRGAAPPELKEVHPLGKSPILVVESTSDKDEEKETLIESRLILQYISDNYTNGAWVPSTPEDRKRDVFFQEFAKSTVHLKASFAMLFDLIPSMLPFGLKQLFRLTVSPIVSHFSSDLADCYEFMEGYLSDETPWFSGAKFGLADLNMLFGMEIVTQRNFRWDASKYPKLAKWHQSMKERHSYQRALRDGEDGRLDLVTFK